MRFPNRLKLAAPVVIVVALLLSACSTFNGSSEVGDLETKNAQLQSTIDVLGTPAATISVLQMTAERSLALQAEMNNVQATALAMQSTYTAMQLGGVRINPTSGAPDIAPGQAVQNVPEGAPTPPSGSGTSFYQTVTATGRDANDCATGVTNSFNINDMVYVIARVSNLKAGSTISARWTANGALVEDSVCWQPGQDWSDVCAYCEISASEAGTWTVEMLLDDQLMSQGQFQVTDPNAGTGQTDTTGEGAAAEGDAATNQ